MKKTFSNKQKIIAISSAVILIAAVALLTVFLTRHHHDFGAWVTTKEATCQEEGIMARYCDCGKTEERSIETRDHSFTVIRGWRENDKDFVGTACDMCSAESDIISEGIFVDESKALYLYECPVDFHFDVVCDRGMDYVKSNVFVADSYFKDLDLSRHTDLVHQVTVTSLGQNVYRISPASNYEENQTYAIVWPDDVKPKDYACKSVSFETLGERENLVKYNENMIFLKAMENASAGYYPYDLIFDEESNKYTLILSKLGDFANEELIGKILCVGECASAEELEDGGRDYTFGKIESVSELDGTVVVMLGEPAIEEIYNELFVSIDSADDLEVAINTEEYQQVLLEEVAKSDGFVQALTASNIAATNFANDNGMALATQTAFDPKKIQFKEKPKVTNGKNENGKSYVELDMVIAYSCTNNLSKGEMVGDITFSFELHPTVKFTFENVKSELVKVTQLEINIVILHESSLTFDMDIQLNLQDTDPAMRYIVSKSGKIHKYTCTTCAQLRKNRANFYTLEQIKEQFPAYVESGCQLCKPFTMDNSYFIYNVDSNVLHCANCTHANRITSAEVIVYEHYPWGTTYTNCQTCKPHQNQKDVEEYLKESIKDSTWDIVFDKLKGTINGAFTKSGLIDAGASPFEDSGHEPLIMIRIEAFEIPIYAAPTFKFDLAATLDFHYETSSAVRYIVSNGVEEHPDAKKGEDKATPRFNVTPQTVVSPKDTTDWTLDAKGQLDVRLGVMAEARFSFAGLSEFLYVGLFGEVGAYSNINGVLHLERAGDNYYAAYLEAGIYFDARLVYKIPIILPAGSKRFFGDDIKKFPLFDAGDSKAYYAFNNDDARISLNKDRMDLPNALLAVSYYDLKQMKNVTNMTLSWQGSDQYSISCEFYNEAGKKVNYCSVENGKLKLTKSAPKSFTVTMVVSVKDSITFSSIKDYLKNRDGSAFYMDTLSIVLTYDENGSDSYSTAAPSDGLAFWWDEELQGWLVYGGECKSKNVVIPSTYAGSPVVGISEGAFIEINFIESVVIPNSVKKIYDVAFGGCTSLKKVVIPDSVIYLQGRVFEGCTSLESVQIGKNVSTMSGWAFEGCTNLTSLSVDSGNATYYSRNNAIIERSTKTLVAGCVSTNIPEDVTAIGEHAFAGRNISKITIPKSVKLIESYAFYDCSKLTSIIIPQNVNQIVGDPFGHCSSLTSITVDQNNKTYSSFDGLLYNKNQTELILVPAGKKTVTLPDSVSFAMFDSFANSLFDSCENLTDIIIGSNHPQYTSVKGVVYNKDCTELLYCPKGKTSVSIQNGVKTIGESAFKRCNKLTSIAIPKSVTTIGESAFRRCNKLTSIAIPKSVTTIEDDAFYDCDNLKKVTLEEGLKRIGSYAFAYCEKLSSISFPDSITSIGDHAFYECEGLKTVKLGKGLTALSNGTFEYCTGLTSVTIQEGVKTISVWSFLGCKNLKTVTLPASLEVLGERSFAFCDNLKTINYKGTKAQWESVRKISQWDYESGQYTIKCTNGKVSKS